MNSFKLAIKRIPKNNREALRMIRRVPFDSLEMFFLDKGNTHFSELCNTLDCLSELTQKSFDSVIKENRKGE